MREKQDVKLEEEEENGRKKKKEKCVQIEERINKRSAVGDAAMVVVGGFTL